jgi:hypothetical protein
MADEEAVAPVAAKIGEHEVSILLSYMDDEHEKAAIEVRLGAPSYEPHPPIPLSQIRGCSGCCAVLLGTRWVTGPVTGICRQGR